MKKLVGAKQYFEEALSIPIFYTLSLQKQKSVRGRSTKRGGAGPGRKLRHRGVLRERLGRSFTRGGGRVPLLLSAGPQNDFVLYNIKRC